MIRTLIMRAYYRGHEENQKQIDNIVAKVLDTITSKERWGYISQYLPELCEASPESVLRKLESEIEVSQGLIDLFAEKDGDFMTSRHYYTNVLWAVEQLIQQKKYVARALEWLWEIDSHNIKFSINNSPKGVLDVVFCAWINESALTVEQKIELARSAIERYPNAWDVIASKLPHGTSSICSTLNTPKYRRIDEPEGKYVYDYVSYLYRKGIVDLSEVIEKVKSISDNKNLLTNLISLELVENYENALIVKENEDIKKMYWSRNGRLRISDKAEHRISYNQKKRIGVCLMGTNFYLMSRNKKLMREYFAVETEYTIKDIEYEIVDEPYLGYNVHLCKLSAGWRPLFQRHKTISTFKEVEEFCLKNKSMVSIYDEYGRRYTWKQYFKKVYNHSQRKAEPRKWIYDIDPIFPDNGPRLHMASCTEQEAEIYMPFCHREYNEKEKLAKERFHVHERIWSDEKSWEDPDYPFDWTEGEFC